MRVIRLFLTGFLLLSILTGAVHAQDEQSRKITFTVPVELQQIHENMHDIWLWCALFDAQNNSINVNVSETNIVPFDRSTGTFSGNVTFDVTAREGFDIVNATRYVITMFFHYRSSLEGGDWTGVEPEIGHRHIEARPREGTEFVSEVRGDIQW